MFKSIYLIIKFILSIYATYDVTSRTVYCRIFMEKFGKLCFWLAHHCWKVCIPYLTWNNNKTWRLGYFPTLISILWWSVIYVHVHVHLCNEHTLTLMGGMPTHHSSILCVNDLWLQILTGLSVRQSILL